MAATATTNNADWLIPVGLLALSTVPIMAGTSRLVQLGGGAAVTPENARFFAVPVPVVLHIVSVAIYSVLGAFQFAPGIRRRNRGWHRAAGKLLVVLGFAAALTGLWMAKFYPWPPGDGHLVYAFRLVFGTAMAVSLSLAVRDIFRRDYVSHGEWMTRAYAIGLGAGTQVFTHLPYFMLISLHPGELPRGLMMGAGWVINVIVAEWIIHRRSLRLTAARAVHA